MKCNNFLCNSFGEKYSDNCYYPNTVGCKNRIAFEKLMKIINEIKEALK